MEQRKQGRGWHGHFLGFRARLNCEEAPVLPAWIVRANLDDPRKIPYLLVWRDEREIHGSAYRLYDGEIKEAVRLTCYADRCPGYVELKRTDGTTTILRIVWRALPRNGGGAPFLLCPYCNIPRRFVYGWEWDWTSRLSNRVRQVCWQCRSCAQLRYSGRSSSQTDNSSQLEAIQSAVEELTKNLCGDKALEKAIEMTNEAGATLTDEELAYEGGSLTRIEQEIRALSQRDILNTISASLSNIEKTLRQKQDTR